MAKAQKSNGDQHGIYKETLNEKDDEMYKNKFHSRKIKPQIQLKKLST